jgi:hypothetical protein
MIDLFAISREIKTLLSDITSMVGSVPGLGDHFCLSEIAMIDLHGHSTVGRFFVEEGS